MPLVILGPMVAGIVLLTRTLTNYYLRKRMVEKGYVDQESVAILAREKKQSDQLSNLKWGLVVFCTGLGLVILEFIDFEAESPLPYGVFALSVSMGFLIYFFVARNMKGNE